jgi:ankyrin repeat protein
MFEATRRNDVAALAFLFDLGVSPDVEMSDHTRALHIAARTGSLEAAQLLVERGAEADCIETTWGGTPLGSATYAGEQRLIDFLARYSRDIWCLTFNGKIDRVRELLQADASLARASDGGSSLLFWLPRDDESRAIALARLLLDHGADPSIKGSDGRTAADRAERLAMLDLAGVLGVRVG